MKIGLKFPEQLGGFLVPVRDAFEDLITGIQNGWFQQHNVRGEHTAMTALQIGNPLPSESNVLAITSGVRLIKGPLTLADNYLLLATGTGTMGGIAPSQIAGNVNDYSPQGLPTALVVRLDLDTHRSMTGLRAPQPNGWRLIVLVNGSAFRLTLTHEDTASAAANRFSNAFGVDTVLGAYESAMALYDPAAQRWRTWTLESHPRCIAYHDTTQSINDATWTALNLNSEDIDINGMHSTSSNTSRITIPVGGAGYYHVALKAGFAGNTTGDRLMSLGVNGNFTTANARNVYSDNGRNPAASGLQIMNGSVMQHFVAGDYVEIAVYQNSGAALNVGSANRLYSTEFSVVRVA